MTLKEAYSYAVTFLERNGVDESDFKALCVVCSILNIKTANMTYTETILCQTKNLPICFGN